MGWKARRDPLQHSGQMPFMAAALSSPDRRLSEPVTGRRTGILTLCAAVLRPETTLGNRSQGMGLLNAFQSRNRGDGGRGSPTAHWPIPYRWNQCFIPHGTGAGQEAPRAFVRRMSVDHPPVKFSVRGFGPRSSATFATQRTGFESLHFHQTKGPGQKAKPKPSQIPNATTFVTFRDLTCSCGCNSFRLTESSGSFNAEFYVASVTVIPIFFITLTVEVRAASYPSMRRMVALYRYRKLRRFESIRERFHWLIRGMLVALMALLVPVVALGWAAEVIALLALDKRTIGLSQHSFVVIGVVALPTVVFLWAIAIREREPTPLDEELDRLFGVAARRSTE